MTLSKAVKPAEKVTISIDTTGPALRVDWGTVSAAAPFKIG
jgi:hypothetical protein